MTAELSQIRTVDVCSSNINNRKCLFTINLGPIYKSDSLFGYDFQVSYDRSKLRFDRGIFTNTLSEQFDETTRAVTIGFDSATVRGYAVSLDIFAPPVSGDKPLVAFLFDYLGDCPDTTTVKFDFIEFTDEFKGNIKEYKDALVTGELIDKNTRHLSAEFDRDTLFFENTKQDELILKFNYGIETKIKSAEFELLTTNGNVRIRDVQPLTDKIEITEKIAVEYGYNLIKMNIKDSISGMGSMKVLIYEVTTEADTSKIFIGNLHPNDCSCVTDIKEDAVLLKSEKDSSSSAVSDTGNEFTIARYDRLNDIFEIQFGSSAADKIEVYDIMGRKLVSEAGAISGRLYRLDTRNFSNGVYNIIIYTAKDKKRLLLIKN